MIHRKSPQTPEPLVTPQHQQCHKEEEEECAISPLPLSAPIDYSAIQDSADEILLLLNAAPNVVSPPFPPTLKQTLSSITALVTIPPPIEKPQIIAIETIARQPCAKVPSSTTTTTPTSSFRRKWTPEEDALLSHAITILGERPPHSWNKISKDFFNGSRTSKQLSNHWKRCQQKKQISNKENIEWSGRDKDKLLNLVQSQGKKWSLFAKFMRRTPRACQEMWEAITEREERRKHRRTVSIDETAATSTTIRP